MTQKFSSKCPSLCTYVSNVFFLSDNRFFLIFDIKSRFGKSFKLREPDILEQSYLFEIRENVSNCPKTLFINFVEKCNH